MGKRLQINVDTSAAAGLAFCKLSRKAEGDLGNQNLMQGDSM